MDLKLAICNLVGTDDIDPADYLVLRAGQREVYERLGCTYVGEIAEARGVTGRSPMIVMRKAPVPVPEPIKDTAIEQEGGILSKFRRGLGRE